ncbi:hypothetical protein F444_13620 [Phytophthora nicotianae P1976]|uniref:Uncharacterized protein n=1 Tax=Phytophthora nicotianae P1976 TaxID=1317066 RepID=A0A080ZT98_PHYNI|nr:hypothetical protein F444_13620 [Phytophthora nicotianae P1976]
MRRMQFALSRVNDDTMEFDPLMDVIHVDEKWFNEDKDRRSYLLLDGETVPSQDLGTTCIERQCSTEKLDSGLLRRSTPPKDPARGAKCTRNVSTDDRTLYKHYIIHNVIPAIKAKWPRNHKNRPSYIQQDNAKPHESPRDTDMMNVGQSDGWNIVVMFQPSNSPDLNVLDLGFFASIQSIQYKKIISGIENLILAVKDAFDSVDIETIDKFSSH